jgi:hypothetical protein
MTKKEKVRVVVAAEDGDELFVRTVDFDKRIEEALDATTGFGSGVSAPGKKREAASKKLQAKGTWSFRGDYLDDYDDTVEDAKITVEIMTIPVRVTNGQGKLDCKVSKQQFDKALKCLVDNGIEIDEAETVLQALCYILLDTEIDIYFSD